MKPNDQIIPAHKKIEKSDLFWLVYLFFFLIEPIARHSARFWIVSLAWVAAYIGLYLVFLRFCNLRLRLALLAGMYLLGALTYPSNGGGTCFMIYAAALLPFVISSVPWVLTAVLTESILLALEGAYFHISPYSWFSSILLIITIAGSNIFFAQKRRADYKLGMQQEEIEALAAVAERERIARDLHDVLGHTLSVIVLKAELANRLLQRELAAIALATPEALSSPPEAPTSTSSSRPECSEVERPAFSHARADGTSQSTDTVHQASPDLPTLQRAQTEIAEVERTARTALAEVREAIGGYRARGLAAEIDGARQTLASAGVALTTEGDLHPATLTAGEETVLALALREAVTNIVRHAQATTCRLRLLNDRGHHRLSIQDNGHNPVTREGNGLRGMRERVEALGGQLHLTRDAGTLLQIDLPNRATT